jgi:Domain of unknown function (DUF4136)
MQQVWQVVRGSLIVAMLDGTSKQEVWRAVATDTLGNDGSFDATRDLSKTQKKVDKVVEKMFKYYPGTTK